MEPPESDPKQPPQPLVMRDSKGRLLPGSKLQTPGRPLSLARYIAKQTDDGRELVERFLEIFRGADPKFKAREQIEAGKWLGDRLWGKAIDIQAIANLNPEGDAAGELREVAAAALVRLATAVAGRQVPPSTETVDLLPERGSGVVVNEDPQDIP